MAYLKAFITNLGEYNKGETVGEWVEFPISKNEFEKTLTRIDLYEEDQDGEIYEEWFVRDYDCDLSGVADELGEYASYKDLNDIGEIVSGFSTEEVEFYDACLARGDNFWDAVYTIQRGYIKKISNDGKNDIDEIIGHYYVGQIGISSLSDEDIEYYTDFESLGRDIRLDYTPENDDAPQTAEEYWCDDENAPDSDIGKAAIEALGIKGIKNIEDYFDFKSYGDDIRWKFDYVQTSDGVFEFI